MNALLPPPDPAAARPARRAAREHGPERRAVQIGVVGTVLVHALLLWLAPRLPLTGGDGKISPAGESGGAAFEVEFLPASPAAPPAGPEPTRLIPVETNPAAPDNIPDRTDLTGAQNQQAAQETPTPDGRSPVPAVRGDPDKPSTAIVTGQLAEPRPLPVAPEPPPAPPDEQRVAQREQNPLPGDERFQGTAPDGLRGGLAPPAPNPGATERVEGRPDATRESGFTIGLTVAVDPLHPRTRPTLPASAAPQAPPAPLLDNTSGASRVGLTAYDAKWSAYGEYLQRLHEIIGIQWRRLMGPGFVLPSPGTRVHVRFRLDASGEIPEILSVTGNARLDTQSVCVGAITDRSPYGPWPADMVAVLGDSQVLTFSFYYE